MHVTDVFYTSSNCGNLTLLNQLKLMPSNIMKYGPLDYNKGHMRIILLNLENKTMILIRN